MTLIEQFASAATQAYTVVSVARSDGEAARLVADALGASGGPVVMVSPDAAAPPWSCGTALAAAGARVVTRSASRNDRAELVAADAGVTVAAFGIADTGTLVLCASAGDHRLDSLVPPVHVALVLASALVPDLRAAFTRLVAEDCFARHSAVTFVRGPSRTADIELMLTIGVHGPKKLYVVVLDDLPRA